MVSHDLNQLTPIQTLALLQSCSNSILISEAAEFNTLITMPEDRGEAQERVEPMEEEETVGEAEEEGEGEVEAEVDDAGEEEDVEVTEDEAAELAGLNR